MRGKQKPIYMGAQSTARIPTRGAVNEDWELLLQGYATAYDGLSGGLLTPDPRVMAQASANEIKARFYGLKIACKRNQSRLLPTIKKLESIALANNAGRMGDRTALNELKKVVYSNGLNPGVLMVAEQHVNAAEQRVAMAAHAVKNRGYAPTTMRTKGRPGMPMGAPRRSSPRTGKVSPMGLLNALFGTPLDRKTRGRF